MQIDINDKYRVVAVIVTYNRKKLLEECLAAVLGQNYSVAKIIVINNCSTDGTDDLLKHKYCNDKILVYKTDRNIGGAGGFAKGMELCKEIDCDWVWLMDDDTIPQEDCLLELLKTKEIAEDYNSTHTDLLVCRRIGFIASAVYGSNGEFMNLPEISHRVATNGYEYWYKLLDKSIVNITCATFVSVIVPKDAIAKCGVPCADFFIWGDDTEYTTRLSTFYGDGFFVGKSIAIHKRSNAQSISVETEVDVDRIKLMHYLYRNQFVTNLYYGRRFTIIKALYRILTSLNLLRKNHGFIRAWAVIKGHFEGVIIYNKLRKQIDSQLNNI